MATNHLPNKQETIYSYYSIVLLDLPPEINANTIQPYVNMKNEDGEQVFNSDGKPMTRQHNPDTHGPIEDNKIIEWKTPNTIYQGITGFSRTQLNAIKNYINQNKSAVCYHYGDQDPGCQFNGYHLHIMMRLETMEKHIQHSYKYKHLKKITNLEIKSEKIVYPTKFMKFLTKPPRIYKGTNDETMKEMLLQENKTNSNIYETTSQAKTNKNKQHNQIENTIKLMNIYGTTEKYQIFRKIMRTPHHDEDLQLYKELTRSNNWINKTKEQNYYDVFMSLKEIRQPTLSIKDTAEYYILWTAEQNIDPMELMLQIFAHFKQLIPKKNTLYLQGESNAGNTYFLEGLVPHKDITGSHITSKELILIMN